MSNDWEGNRSSGFALAMRHRLVVYSPTGLRSKEGRMNAAPQNQLTRFVIVRCGFVAHVVLQTNPERIKPMGLIVTLCHENANS